MLNSGPLKHAATAIVGCPPRAMTTSEAKSPTLLPHASTDTDSAAGDTPMAPPIAVRHPRSSVAATAIHATEHRNETTSVAGPSHHGGGVQSLIPPPPKE